MGLFIVAFMLGAIFAFIAVLAIWLVLGHGKVMWRAIFAIAGASGLAIAFCAASGELEAEWLGLVWVVVVTITALFIFVRWLGFKLVDTTSGSHIRSGEMQFSLAQIMVLTAVVAAIAAAASMLSPLVVTINALIFGLATAVCFGTLALVAAWATLGANATRIRISILASVAIIIAGLVYAGMEATNADPGLVWGLVVIVYAIALAGLLLLARSRGSRLVHDSGRSGSTACHATDPGDEAERATP